MIVKINLGTFDLKTVKQIQRGVRERKKKPVGTPTPCKVSVMGRQPKEGARYNSRTIPLSQANAGAVYIEVDLPDVPDFCERRALAERMAEHKAQADAAAEVISRADKKIEELKEEVQYLDEHPFTDNRQTQDAVEYIIRKKMQDAKFIRRVLVGGYKGLGNLTDRDILGVLMNEIREENTKSG